MNGIYLFQKAKRIKDPKTVMERVFDVEIRA